MEFNMQKQRLFLLKKYQGTDILVEVKDAVVQKDGTIWDETHTIPLIQPTEGYDKQWLDALIEEKAFDKIPDVCYVRINQKTYIGKEFILEQDYLERVNKQGDLAKQALNAWLK